MSGVHGSIRNFHRWFSAAPAASSTSDDSPHEFRRNLPQEEYTSRPADHGLVTLLQEAFHVLENCFRRIDADNVGEITFEQLARDLSMYGFVEEERLEDVFVKVDTNNGGEGTLDFFGFLCMMYHWQVEIPTALHIIYTVCVADVL